MYTIPVTCGSWQGRLYSNSTRIILSTHMSCADIRYGMFTPARCSERTNCRLHNVMFGTVPDKSKHTAVGHLASRCAGYKHEHTSKHQTPHALEHLPQKGSDHQPRSNRKSERQIDGGQSRIVYESWQPPTVNVTCSAHNSKVV